MLKGLIKGIEKTRKEITGRIYAVTDKRGPVGEAVFDGIEEALISADMGVAVTDEVIGYIRREASIRHINDAAMLIGVLREKLETMLLDRSGHDVLDKSGRKKIILVVGVNGTGKTTSVGKIAYLFTREGSRPLIAAADTFRAAAADQLQIWADRTKTGIIRQKEGADPSSVIFDAIVSMNRGDADVLICDTAGRLQNKKNLMNELKKIYTTISRNAVDTDVYTLLVIDASTGQNGVSQAKMFREAADVDGIILTKIDGTAKGGIIFPIAYEVGIPVKFIGTGETMTDMETFDAKRFISAIFDTNDGK